MPHDINGQQSFEALSLKPNGQSKTQVRTTESHPIQQSPGVNRPWKIAAAPPETRHSSQIKGDIALADHHLDAN